MIAVFASMAFPVKLTLATAATDTSAPQGIAEVLNKTPNIEELPMQPGDVERTFADISKANRLIGYEPKTSFKQGIENFVKWYIINKELY